MTIDDQTMAIAGNSAQELLPRHGGYRKLKSFQIAQLVYDLTVRFCGRYVDRHSRTNDQMVQAARSGVQNIAEGSQASGTSRKTELKLTNVARASLEELKLDYEDFLRQRGLAIWSADDPRRKELVQMRCQTAEEVAHWVRQVRNRELKAPNSHNSSSGTPASPSIKSIPSIESIESIEPPPPPYSSIAANALLVLIGVVNALLDRQIKALADAFIKEGGFTEKLYQARRSQQKRK